MDWYRWLGDAAIRRGRWTTSHKVSWLELRSYMVNTLLRDTDAMSMRNSLEVRVPFLDTPLMEYVLALPESEKRRYGRPKALLIEALGNLLPDEVVNQPKRTFTFPWNIGCAENWESAWLLDWGIGRPLLERFWT